MTARKLFLILAAASLMAPGLRAAEPAPDPAKLLLTAMAEPATPYQGRVTLTRWQGARAKSEEANVFFRPPHTYRVEFLTPAGEIDRVVLSDGHRREVQLLKDGSVTGSDESDSGALLSDEEKRGLLLLNYRVTLAGTEKVLARSAWVLELTPVVPGKPSQRMLVDRDSHVVLEVRRVGDGAGATTQFTRFEPNVLLPDALFSWLSPLPSDAEATPEALSPEAGWPSTLPGGFSLASSSAFEVNRQRVRQYRYSDGLSYLSLFVTAVPVSAPEGSVSPSDPIGPQAPEAVRQWRSGSHYFTAVGELTEPLLAQIQQQIN